MDDVKTWTAPDNSFSINYNFELTYERHRMLLEMWKRRLAEPARKAIHELDMQQYTVLTGEDPPA